MASTNNQYTQLGRFVIRGEEDLAWKPDEGEEEQESIEAWMASTDKVRLLVLACLGGRVSVDLKEELNDRAPDH